MERMGLKQLAMAFLASACCHGPETKMPAEQPGAVETNKVLDALKEDLDLFAHTMPTTVPSGTVCKGPNGQHIVSLVPETATLVLKTVGTNVTSGTAAVAIPIGSVLTVTPGFSGSYTRVGTQQVTLTLNIDHSKTKKELRADIESLQKEMESDKKLSDTIGVLPADVKAINETKAIKLKDEFQQLVHAEQRGVTPSPKPDKVYQQDAFKGHALSEALYMMREGLLATNHDKTPCLQPNDLKAEVDFQVTTKLDANGKLSFLIVSIGAEYTHTDDVTQTLVVSFDLSDSSTLLLKNQ